MPWLSPDKVQALESGEMKTTLTSEAGDIAGELGRREKKVLQGRKGIGLVEGYSEVN